MNTDTFFTEYTSHDAILKYTKATAGYGISYLLDHDYKEVYLKALEHLPAQSKQKGIRMLEFGCGAGMNLVHLVGQLGRHGIKVSSAVGSDFSPVLIEAAQREAASYLAKEDRSRAAFCVAKNETLKADLAAATEKGTPLDNSFDFILGVNTIRYCHRSNKQLDCARDIYDLLIPGGVGVIIDMNNRFPAFRSALKAKVSGSTQTEEECYLPTLDEYAEPFAQAGFEILRKENFCWIPHSAGRVMSRVYRLATPILNLFARSRAMRSLILVRKPINQGKR